MGVGVESSADADDDEYHVWLYVTAAGHAFRGQESIWYDARR